MCTVCLCVTRQCHCVPAGQQIPPDHSSEWALIPLGLFMSLPPLSMAAGWECGPGMLTDQIIRTPAPLIAPPPPPQYTHSRSLPPKHYPTATANQCPLAPLSYQPKQCPHRLCTSQKSGTCPLKLPAAHTIWLTSSLPLSPSPLSDLCL